MRIENWGIVPYQEALSRQLEKVEAVAAGAEDTLIFCSHPPVVTLGRGTKPGDVTSWIGETVQISRGGRATYHGPSQLVIYPIINLNIKRNRLPERDLHKYLRLLEEAIVLTLKKINLDSEARTIKLGLDEPSLTGVWVKDAQGADKKIASIGIAVKKWVTYHGVAINFKHDAAAFSGIRPCGFNTEIMTSVEEQYLQIDSPLPELASVQKLFAQILSEATSYQS